MNILNSGRFSVGCAAAGAMKKVIGEFRLLILYNHFMFTVFQHNHCLQVQ